MKLSEERIAQMERELIAKHIEENKIVGDKYEEAFQLLSAARRGLPQVDNPSSPKSELTEGQYYVNRLGIKVGPLKKQFNSEFWPWHIEGEGSFDRNGNFNGKYPHDKDLVESAPQDGVNRFAPNAGTNDDFRIVERVLLEHCLDVLVEIKKNYIHLHNDLKDQTDVNVAISQLKSALQIEKSVLKAPTEKR